MLNWKQKNPTIQFNFFWNSAVIRYISIAVSKIQFFFRSFVRFTGGCVLFRLKNLPRSEWNRDTKIYSRPFLCAKLLLLCVNSNFTDLYRKVEKSEEAPKVWMENSLLTAKNSISENFEFKVSPSEEIAQIPDSLSVCFCKISLIKLSDHHHTLCSTFQERNSTKSWWKCVNEEPIRHGKSSARYHRSLRMGSRSTKATIFAQPSMTQSTTSCDRLRNFHRSLHRRRIESMRVSSETSFDSVEWAWTNFQHAFLQMSSRLTTSRVITIIAAIFRISKPKLKCSTMSEAFSRHRIHKKSETSRTATMSATAMTISRRKSSDCVQKLKIQMATTWRQAMW